MLDLSMETVLEELGDDSSDAKAKGMICDARKALGAIQSEGLKVILDSWTKLEWLWGYPSKDVSHP